MIPEIKRIMIFGRPGSGKSVFAAQLAQKLHIPLHHLDRHFFVEDWKKQDPQVFDCKKMMSNNFVFQPPPLHD